MGPLQASVCVTLLSEGRRVVLTRSGGCFFAVVAVAEGEEVHEVTLQALVEIGDLQGLCGDSPSFRVELDGFRLWVERNLVAVLVGGRVYWGGRLAFRQDLERFIKPNELSRNP